MRLPLKNSLALIIVFAISFLVVISTASGEGVYPPCSR